MTGQNYYANAMRGSILAEYTINHNTQQSHVPTFDKEVLCINRNKLE